MGSEVPLHPGDATCLCTIVKFLGRVPRSRYQKIQTDIFSKAHPKNVQCREER